MSAQGYGADQSADLRDSVRDYRDPATTDEDRESIRQYWNAQGIRNQFGAMLQAAELDQCQQVDQRGDDADAAAR